MNTYPTVYLVGAGPGDPELLTIKALRRLKQADVVLYDRLVSDEIMDLIPTGVSRLSVAKKTGHHCVPQNEINNMLVKLAKQGRKVVRLKGGDPYMFGRGGEEAVFLKQEGIPFEVVPGISAAVGCGASSGIPLTYRGMATSVRFMTGHFEDDKVLTLDWGKIADPDCTLVIYMGLSNLPLICRQLQLAGLPASTPAAAIHKGTTHQQKRVLSTLYALSQDVKNEGWAAPVIIIIGKVVALADELEGLNDLSGLLQDQMNYKDDNYA